MKPSVIFLLVAVMCAGCTARSTSTGVITPLPDESSVNNAITMAAQDISTRLEQLSKIEAGPDVARYEAEVANEPIITSGPLAQESSFRWSGPLVPAVKALAQLSGFEVEVLGRLKTAAPVLIHIDAHRVPLIKILSDIGWQVGDNVGLHVKEPEKKILIVFTGGSQ